MTIKEFYQAMAEAKPHMTSMPPIKIGIGPADIMAAKLLIWLHEQLSDDTTWGDLEDILDAAKWWVVFWASATTATKKMEQIDASPEQVYNDVN